MKRDELAEALFLRFSAQYSHASINVGQLQAEIAAKIAYMFADEFLEVKAKQAARKGRGE